MQKLTNERLQQIKERYDDEMIRREHVAELIDAVDHLTTELAALKRWDTHWTHDEITRREHDHTRWHQCDNPWTPPPGLPRDPNQEKP